MAPYAVNKTIEDDDGGMELACSVAMHPSFIGEAALQAMEQLEKDCPVMVLSAGMDGGNVKEHGAIHKILQQKTFGSDCEFKTYTGRCHGCVNRGDMNHPAVAKDVDGALGRAEEFLQRHLFT